MYFKRIEMHGFKSFVEPVVVEFDRGITCVVGPNGSGKSNISDAIRWVLGEQSSKMLRCDRMEDVIFAGTTSRKSRGMAEVTLVIDNSTGILPIDYSEVAITRRLFRSGESEYAINNNPCRLRDITELLLDTGIGVEGYSLIGQGHIVDIISNKSESIKEIFEESAGIVSYRKKKEDAERKLASSTANMERVADIIGEIEGRIGGLREDSAKATEYLELRKRYQDLEINIALRSIESIEARAKEYAADVAHLTRSIEEAARGKQTLYQDLEALRLQTETLDALGNQTQEDLLAHIEEINILVNRNEVASERLAALEKDSQRLIGEIGVLESKLEREAGNAAAQSESKADTDGKLSALMGELENKIKAYQLANGDLAGETARIDGLKSKLFDLHNGMNARKAQIQSLKSLMDTLDKRKAQIQEDLARGQSGNLDTQTALSETREALALGEAEQDARARRRDEAKALLARNLEEERTLSRDLEALRIRMGQVQARKKTIEEMESNYEGYNGAVKHIMRSGLKGLRGVVADLISVPAGYEIAVETALGGALQHVVCDRDETAKAGVAELKASRAGRLTFLPVASVKAGSGPKAGALAGQSGFLGFAADLVKTDSEYVEILRYLLGRVAVTKTMDDAIRLSKTAEGGLRFVTLEGEIINANGAITGGRYKNPTANLLERKAEVGELGRTLSEMESRIADLETRLAALRTETADTRGSLESLDEALRAGELENFALRSRMEAMETALGDFLTAAGRWEQELAAIARDQEKAGVDIRQAEDDVRKFQEDIQETENGIEAGAAALDAEKDALGRASEEITKARIAVAACENEKSKIDAIVERIQEAIAELTQEKDQKERELARHKTERDQILSGFNGEGDRVREKEKAKEALQDQLQRTHAQRAQAGSDLTRLYGERDRLDETLGALQGQKYELEVKMAKQEAQLENFKERLWDEFELSYAQAQEFRAAEFSMSAAVRENRDIKARLRELGEVNVGAIKEYQSVSGRYEFLTAQRRDIEASMEQLFRIIGDMDKIIRTRFKDSFDQIVQHFEEIFVEFFGGGKATILLSDEGNPLDSEIQITAQPPGKQLKSINLLSGGEKTMTAIALMFAVLRTKPTPCCILDEVEAALDDTNIDIFAKYLKKFEDIQFTLITHQKATMEHADAMYGVTMPERGVSRIYSLRLGDEEFHKMLES